MATTTTGPRCFFLISTCFLIYFSSNAHPLAHARTITSIKDLTDVACWFQADEIRREQEDSLHMIATDSLAAFNMLLTARACHSIFLTLIYIYPFSTGLLSKNPWQKACIIQTAYLHSFLVIFC